MGLACPPRQGWFVHSSWVMCVAKAMARASLQVTGLVGFVLEMHAPSCSSCWVLGMMASLTVHRECGATSFISVVQWCMKLMELKMVADVKEDKLLRAQLRSNEVGY